MPRERNIGKPVIDSVLAVLAKRGGHARAKKLTAEQRSDSARKAARARWGIPVEQTNLTAEERALLPNPRRVTEDDADFIIGRRAEQEGKPIPLKDALEALSACVGCAPSRTPAPRRRRH